LLSQITIITQNQKQGENVQMGRFKKMKQAAKLLKTEYEKLEE
jgi:hypothetical protein